MPTLARKHKYTIDVEGFASVTYSRGEDVPDEHFEHVPAQDRMFFDTEDEPEANDESESEDEDA